jgi:hypothetical protein
MKYLLIWIGYELLRPKVIWLLNYLIRKGGGN